MSKKEKPKKEKQLDLGLKQSPKNFLYKIKRGLDAFLVKFEIKRFLRSPFTWFTIIISLSLIFFLFYILIQEISIYPKELPVWQNQTSLYKRLADKDSLYFFPVASSIVLLSGILFANFFYHKEKFLSKILLLTVLLSIIGLTLSFLKLIP
jgi:hypothetical protein